MADPDPLEELSRYLATAPPAIQRLHRIVCEILRPPPSDPPPTLH
jgi:hypothetical protein